MEPSTSTGKIKLVFDADVILPQVSNYSVIKISKKSFTSENYKAMFDYFAQDAELFYPWPLTKAELKEMIRIAQQSNNDSNETDDASSEQYITELEEQLKQAPTEVMRVPFELGYDIDGNIQNRDEYYACLFYNNKNAFEISSFSGAILGNYFNYSRCYNTVLQDENMVAQGEALPDEPSGATIDGINITQTDAIKQANLTIQNFNISNLTLDNSKRARLVDINSREIVSVGWLFTYTQMYNGIIFYDMGKNVRYSYEYLPVSGAPWPQEKIQIYIDDSGIGYFNWEGASEFSEVIADNIELMPFDELIKKITLQIENLYALSGSEAAPFHIDINNIRLGYALLSISGEDNFGQLVPAWFVSFSYGYENDDIGKDELVFCAYDGSYIEPRLTVGMLNEIVGEANSIE
jgi:hypothetical protein